MADFVPSAPFEAIKGQADGNQGDRTSGKNIFDPRYVVILQHLLSLYKLCSCHATWLSKNELPNAQLQVFTFICVFLLTVFMLLIMFIPVQCAFEVCE